MFWISPDLTLREIYVQGWKDVCEQTWLNNGLLCKEEWKNIKDTENIWSKSCTLR